MLLAAFLLSVAPRSKGIPFALELWMAFGWTTGAYLSLTALTIRPIAVRFLSGRPLAYLEIAHGLNLPIVVGGVGTWAIVKALGLL